MAMNDNPSAPQAPGNGFAAAAQPVAAQSVIHTESDGLAVGTTTLFDRHGPLGSAVVSTLANGDQAVDPALASTRGREPAPHR